MKLTIFGANCATGRVLVRQALEAGHEVSSTAVDPHPHPTAGSCSTGSPSR
jgi:putative NADH-flavin reductase